MADISRLSRLVTGVQRQVDLQSNALVVGSLKVGSATPTELTKAILDNLIALQNGSDFSDGTNAHTHDGRYYTETEMGSTSNGQGASLVGIEDASSYFTGTNMEVALNELEAQIGGLTSSTFSFTEANVLANNDALYAALDKLDLRWGDLASVANGEGASLVGIEDAGSFYTGTNVEAALAELDALLGSDSSTAHDFSENNVLADNDAVYAALEKLDLRHGDLASTANAEGASLIGVEDSAGSFTATDVEGVLAELQTNIQNSAAGVNAKDAARLATTGDLGASYAAGGGAGGTGQFTSAPTTIDGVSIAQGDRIVVKDQSDALQNGIYVVTATTTTWDRAADHDGSPSNEVKAGNLVFVQEGTANANTQFYLTGDGELTLNTDDIDWVVFSRAEAISAGDGLNQSGLVLSVDVSDIAGNGLENDGSNNLRIADTAAGSGLSTTAAGSGILQVNVDDSTIEINTDTLRVKADGIGAAEILLENDSWLTGRNAGDSADVNIIKVNASDEVEFALLPRLTSTITPSADTDLATKKYVDDVAALQDDASEITYTPAVLTDWNGDADPGNVNDALDQLASRAKALEGGASALTEDIAAGETLTSGLRALRYGMTGASETAGRVYLADPTELSVSGLDPFYAIGLAAATGETAGTDVTVYKTGIMPASSHGFTVGQPIYLDSTGGLTSTAPTTAAEAVVKVGIAKDADNIEVQIQVMGVN